MELHRVRLIDHVHLRAKDLAASKRFYAAIFDALGIPYVQDDTHLQADEFWMDAGDGSKVHLAFQAKDLDMVDKVYAAALAAGGRDNGELLPRSRRQQHRSRAPWPGPALRRQRDHHLRDAQGLTLRRRASPAIFAPAPRGGEHV